jgi:hypothetical protein
MDERERLLDQRDRLVAERTTGRNLQSRMIRLRIEAADRADKMAAEAEAYAAYLESSALPDDADNRFLLVQRERDIAAVERRNAVKLRQAGSAAVRLEGLPRLAKPVKPG